MIGATVRLADVPHTVVGVMPQGFAFPVSHRFWVPFRANVVAYQPGEGPSIQIFGRLAPRVTLEQAQAELTGIGRRMAAELPGTHEHVKPRVVPYTRMFFGSGGGSTLYLVEAFFVMLLLVICINVASLVFARTAARQNEIVVRHALGADRRRIVGQLFAEVLVLSLAAAVVGLTGLAFGLEWLMSNFWEAFGERAPFWWDDGLSWGTALYAVGLALLGAAVAGLIPALKVTGKNIQGRLRSMSQGLSFGGAWTAVIVIQVAFAVAILPAGITAVWGSVKAGSSDPGFPAEEYLSVRLELGEDDLPAGDSASTSAFLARLRSTYEELERRLEAEGAVTGVTFADRLPGMDHARSSLEVEGVPAPEESARGHHVEVASVAPDFFDVLGAPILRGTGFPREDAEERIVVVNETFVEKVLHGRNALGRRVRYAARPGQDPGPWYQVAGVVRNLGMDPSRDPLDPGTPAGMYHRLGDPGAPGRAYPLRLAAHVEGETSAFAPRLRRIALDLDPGLRLYDLLPLDQPVDAMSRTQELLNDSIDSLVVVIAALALLLSAAGTYALMAFTVSRRRREIGIRSALGAEPGSLLASIFSRAMGQVGLGILVALALHVVANLLTSGGSSTGGRAEVVLFLLVAAVMLVVGLMACAVPAARALRVQPTEALKEF